MKTLRRNAYLRGYVPAFSLYPTGGGDDPWKDTRIAYEEVEYALWQALHDGVPELEKYTRGTENERPAQEFGKSIRKPISDTPPLILSFLRLVRKQGRGSVRRLLIRRVEKRKLSYPKVSIY